MLFLKASHEKLLLILIGVLIVSIVSITASQIFIPPKDDQPEIETLPTSTIPMAIKTISPKQTNKTTPSNTPTPSEAPSDIESIPTTTQITINNSSSPSPSPIVGPLQPTEIITTPTPIPTPIQGAQTPTPIQPTSTHTPAPTTQPTNTPTQPPTATPTTVPTATPTPSGSNPYSLRFYGNGVSDIDRIKIPIDSPHRTLDVSGDFTLEFFMRANDSDNDAGSCSPGNDNWITGNIIADRDVFGGGDNGDYGVSMFTDGLAFGVHNGSTGTGMCGSVQVDDGNWHHVAFVRESSGAMRIYVDGTLDNSASGPSGDISYRDGRSTSWPNSDPYLVFGAEKHDAGSSFPSFNGFIDEVRLSNTIRYSSNFTPPSTEFSTDANTVLLLHLNTGSGTAATDSSGDGNHGTLQVGGSPSGPIWSTETPF